MASKMATLETALKLMQDLRGSCYSGACQVDCLKNWTC